LKKGHYRVAVLENPNPNHQFWVYDSLTRVVSPIHTNFAQRLGLTAIMVEWWPRQTDTYSYGIHAMLAMAHAAGYGSTFSLDINGANERLDFQVSLVGGEASHRIDAIIVVVCC